MYSDDRFEWSIVKSDETYRRRGFDFAFASCIFDSLHTEDFDEAHDRDEDRCLCVGRVNGRFVTVVYAQRGERKRIISAWLSSSEEIDGYARAFGN